MSVCHLHMDPDVYPEPYKFIPERWMGDFDPRVTGNFVPFVKESRNCLGFKYDPTPPSLPLPRRLSNHKYIVLRGPSCTSSWLSFSSLVVTR